MAKAKTKGKPKAPKRVPFGGYVVCFKRCTDTLESLFGSAPMPPSGHDEAALGDTRDTASRRQGRRRPHVRGRPASSRVALDDDARGAGARARARL